MCIVKYVLKLKHQNKQFLTLISQNTFIILVELK